MQLIERILPQRKRIEKALAEGVISFRYVLFV